MMSARMRAGSGRPSNFHAAAIAAGTTPQTGLGAVEGRYRDAIATESGIRVTGSVDIDSEFMAAEPNANRWDYGIGVARGDAESACWVEPHPASSTSEVDVMLRKLAWLKQKLGGAGFEQLRAMTHRTGRDGIAYRWLAQGAIHIRAGSREAQRLAKAGLAMPSRRVMLP